MKHLLRKALLLPILLLVSCVLFAQQKTVTGKVVDADGKPVHGVNVGIKGSTKTTTTDADGNYSIVVSSNEAVLKFSSATFVYQEMLVGEKTTVDLTMQKDTKQLDDVVVIGYGTQKARNVTGSVATIPPKKLEDLPVSSITEMLRGQVPGLNVVSGNNRPGSFPSINIRQQFNWGKDGSSPSPLIVIDDVVQIDPSPSNSFPSIDKLNQLDLSEIESITVLRDASAAIYGARGSQGAIIIKTKRGKSGVPKVSYAGKFETNDAISHSKVMNAKEYGIFSNRLNRQNAGANTNVFFTPTELAMMDTINYDWLKNDWNSANAMQHSLNVSGGSERATYFTGGSYYTQGANLGTQTYNRWTFRAGTDVKVVNGVKLSATLSGNNTFLEKPFTKVNNSDAYATTGEQNDYATLLHMPRYVPWIYKINGVDQWIGPPLGPMKPGAATGNSALNQWNYYELINNGSKQTAKQFSYNANFSLQYDVPFIKGLSVRGNYAITSSASNTEQNMFALYLNQLNSNGTANQVANPQTYHLYTPTTVWGAAVLNRSNSRVTYDKLVTSVEQINFFANYDHTFGDHTVSAVFSGERGKTTYDDEFLIYDNPVPGVYNGTSVSAGTFNASNSFTNRSIAGTMSYLGRVSYAYKNKYLLQIVARSDASSHFAPENYWGFFPSVSAGWIISDENFFKISWINYLKLRGSFGKTGNDNVKAWRWLQLYDAATDKGMSFGSGGGTYTVGLTPGVTPYRDVKWDKTFQRNIGIDMSILKSRLTIALDGYFNSSKDMLMTMSNALNVPISVGGAFAEQNYGSVNFWGVEAAATWNDRIGKVDYSIGMNFGVSGNKVTKYLDQPFNYPSTFAGKQLQGYSLFAPSYGYRTWKGTSTGDGMLRTQGDIDAYWAYLTDLATKAATTPLYNAGGANISSKAGLKKGMLAYEDVAGNLNTATRTIAGQDGRVNDDQDYVELAKKAKSYGITTNFSVSYKSLTLMAQIATSWGGWNGIDRIKQGTASTNASYAQVSYLTDMYDSTDNPNGKYPNMFYYDNAYKNSDFWSVPTFRCVVRSLSIGYSLPKSWMDKIHLASGKFILSGYNLWDLYNPYPGKYRNMYDAPNVGFPTLRTWSLGVNLGF